MSSLELRLLGAGTVTLGSEPVTGLRYSKAQALLCYLAISGRPHTRTALAALLWSDMAEDAARTNLRTVLSKLRGRLAPYLVVSRQTLAFNRACGYFLDVERFVEHLREPEPNVDDLRSAVELYRGDLLEGFSVQEAPLFEEWLSGQREWLRGLVIGALHGLALHHLSREERGAAIEYLNRMLELDPWREDGYRQLMRLLAETGRTVEALSRYQQLREILQREFEIEPSVETIGLYEQLRARESTYDPPPVANVHNLPLAALPFVARSETDDIVGLLGEPDCRMLTLVGPGGIGKTRLACEAIGFAAEKFRHGAWFVPLAPLDPAADLGAAILAALGVAQSDVPQADDELLAYLANKNLLLTLDNFEHLRSGSPLLARILGTTPGVTLLVTSRERLNVQGEWTLQVGGMDSAGAVRLFTEAARRAKPDIHFEAAEIELVERICASLKMSPLAVELAAAWVRTLSPGEIQAEIRRNLDILAAPSGASGRHRSIRQVFEHSWKLLSDEERTVLRRSSVFRGGFSRESAQSVIGASLQVLSALVEKGLLSSDGRGRYWRHVLVKQFVDEKAAKCPREAAITAELHLDYYFSRLQGQEQALTGRKQREVLESILADIDNIRRAWAEATEQGRHEQLERVLPSFERVFLMRGRFREAEGLLGACADRLSGSGVSESRVRIRQARFQVILGRYRKAESLLRQSLSVLEESGARHDVALARQLLGGAVYQQGRYAESKSLTLASLALYRMLDDPQGIADTLNNLGNIAELAGEYEAARRFHLEALSLRQEIRDYSGIAVSLVNMGDVASRAGELETAKAFYEESVSLRREIGEQGKIASSLSRLGDTALALDDADKASSYYREALHLAVDINAPPRIVQTLLGVAKVWIAAGRKREAIEVLALIVDHPAAQPWYREQAAALTAELCSELGPATVAMAQARSTRKELVEWAEEVLQIR